MLSKTISPAGRGCISPASRPIAALPRRAFASPMRKLVCPPPGRIVWCGGPLEIAAQLAAAGQVRDRVGTFAEIFWKEMTYGLFRTIE